MSRRRENQFWDALPSEDVTRLATFNSERSRGLMHTPEYAERMAELQRRFNEAREAEARARGWIFA